MKMNDTFLLITEHRGGIIVLYFNMIIYHVAILLVFLVLYVSLVCAGGRFEIN